MQVKFYKGATAQQHKKNPEGLQVQLPGYVSTSSWTGAHDLTAQAAIAAKGRILTPPPGASMGLHQLTLEAFWID